MYPTLQYILQTIDWVRTVEDKFFPLISGELGNSSESAAKYQKKLEDFTPTVKVAFSHRSCSWCCVFPFPLWPALCSVAAVMVVAKQTDWKQL